jgi:ribosomal protein L29
VVVGERVRGTNMTHEELLKKVAEAKKRLEHLRGFL